MKKSTNIRTTRIARNTRNTRITRNTQNANNIQNTPSRSFIEDSVHMHYTCHCSVTPDVSFNNETKNVEIVVNTTCPQCKKGKSIELIMANKCVEVTKCPHPGCDCDVLICKIPIRQFMHILSSRD